MAIDFARTAVVSEADFAGMENGEHGTRFGRGVPEVN
jgi:hypothetical protein